MSKSKTKNIGKFFLIVILFSSFLHATNLYQVGIKNFAKSMQIKKYAPQKAHEEFKKAVKAFEEFVKKNPQSSNAYFYLGRLYFNGWGTKQDYEKAYEYFKKAYNNGTKKALCGLLLAAYKSGKSMDQVIKYYNLLQDDSYTLKRCQKKPIFIKIKEQIKENK